MCMKSEVNDVDVERRTVILAMRYFRFELCRLSSLLFLSELKGKENIIIINYSVYFKIFLACRRAKRAEDSKLSKAWQKL